MQLNDFYCDYKDIIIQLDDNPDLKFYIIKYFNVYAKITNGVIPHPIDKFVLVNVLPAPLNRKKLVLHKSASADTIGMCSTVGSCHLHENILYYDGNIKCLIKFVSDIVKKIHVYKQYYFLLKGHLNKWESFDTFLFKVRKPVNIQKNNYLPLQNKKQLLKYMVAKKMDGIRTLAFIHFDLIYLITPTNITFFKSISTTMHNGTLMDVELLDSKIFVFDILYLDGKSLLNEIFLNRYNALKQLSIWHNDIIFLTYVDIIEFVKNSDPVDSKTDGYIFVDTMSKYQTTSFKYKEKITIDLLFKNGRLYTQSKGNLELFLDEEFFSIKKMQDGVVYEILVESKNPAVLLPIAFRPKLTLYRARHDKLWPNDSAIALENYNHHNFYNLNLADFKKMIKKKTNDKN